MTYLIINTDEGVALNEVLRTINLYIGFTCKNFEEILNQPDFHIIQPGEKGSITIEQSKGLQKNIVFSPFQNNYQFGIILNAHAMTIEAQNALLKTLEEKEENTILILTTNNEKSVLETILSRCKRIYPKEKKKEGRINEHSGVEGFLKKEIYDKVSYVEEIAKEEKVKEFLDDLIGYFKLEYESKILNEEKYEKEIEILKILREAKFRIEKNVNKKVALEYICFKIDQELE